MRQGGIPTEARARVRFVDEIGAGAFLAQRKQDSLAASADAADYVERAFVEFGDALKQDSSDEPPLRVVPNLEAAPLAHHRIAPVGADDEPCVNLLDAAAISESNGAVDAGCNCGDRKIGRASCRERV